MPLLLFAGSAPEFLTEVVSVIVAGALIAYVCYRLGLVPIVGFLIAGVVIGPNALGLVRDRALADAAAEVGVILLLYTIGIEFSLEKLARIKRLIFVGGGAQVLLATVATAAALVLFGVGWRAGIFTGFLVALSSTAIVLKLLGDRGEAGSTQGQVGLGLLIFQDLAIIVMVLLVPVLSGAGGSGAEVVWALAKAGALIGVVLVVARRFMPKLLEMVARTCSPELFLLTIVAICFGTAYLTSLAGVSLSLGAFLAGLIVSESRFSEHALGEILPLQILFSATFFISVGMLLDVRFLVANLPLVLAGVVLVLAVKVLTTAVSVRALGYGAPVAAASALMLAQVGEFSFVLERAGRDVGLTPAGLGATGSQAFIALTVVLMVLTPFLMRAGAWLSARVVIAGERAAAEQTEVEAEAGTEEPSRFEDHVVIAGYGQAARRVVRALGAAGVPFVITTLSPDGANEADGERLPVLRGDSTRQRTLRLAGIERARLLVIADDEPAVVRRVVAVAREVNAGVPVIARARRAADVLPLVAAGVNEVAAEETEAIVRLCAGVLRAYDVADDQIERHAAALRQSDRTALAATPSAASAPPADHVAPAAPAATIDTERLVRFEPKGNSNCSHVSRARDVLPSARGCEECLAIGDKWVHLRVCMTCGHVGCCESSKNKHAAKHYAVCDHPIIRSLEPGESWTWCYADKTYL